MRSCLILSQTTSSGHFIPSYITLGGYRNTSPSTPRPHFNHYKPTYKVCYASMDLATSPESPATRPAPNLPASVTLCTWCTSQLIVLADHLLGYIPNRRQTCTQGYARATQVTMVSPHRNMRPQSPQCALACVLSSTQLCYSAAALLPALDPR